MTIRDITGKKFLMNILNGLAVGTVIALIPGALLTVPLRALTDIWSFATVLLQGLIFYNAMMGLIIGVTIAGFFRLTPIQTGAVGMATMLACGVGRFNGELHQWVLKGTGDVITMGIVAAIAVLWILLIGEKVKAYAILVIPATTMVIAGGLGIVLFPYITMITTAIGQGVAYLVTLKPYIMSVLIAMSFATIILSPITSVGIGIAIGISGIASGAANLGICGAAFGFCVAGWTVNTRGTSIAHFIGSPKISMANAVARPKIVLPILCTAACQGLLAPLFNIQGTPMSAGFGFSGFVGPVAAIDLSAKGWDPMNVLFIFCLFSVVPIILSIFWNYIFVHVLHIIKPEDYYLELK